MAVRLSSTVTMQLTSTLGVPSVGRGNPNAGIAGLPASPSVSAFPAAAMLRPSLAATPGDFAPLAAAARGATFGLLPMNLRPGASLR